MILRRRLGPGQRLDSAKLADELSSSVTPIRDALHLLAGQGLVTTGTGDGFHVPHIDEPALKDLYGWSYQLLSLCLRSWPRAPSPDWTTAADHWGADQATATAALYFAIAHRSPNAEHHRALRALNDRLHALRLVEPIVIGTPDRDLQDLAKAIAADDRAAIRRLLLSQYQLRRRHAAAIVRAYYRS